MDLFFVIKCCINVVIVLLSFGHLKMNVRLENNKKKEKKTRLDKSTTARRKKSEETRQRADL